MVEEIRGGGVEARQGRGLADRWRDSSVFSGSGNGNGGENVDVDGDASGNWEWYKANYLSPTSPRSNPWAGDIYAKPVRIEPEITTKRVEKDKRPVESGNHSLGGSVIMKDSFGGGGGGGVKNSRTDEWDASNVGGTWPRKAKKYSKSVSDSALKSNHHHHHHSDHQQQQHHHHHHHQKQQHPQLTQKQQQQQRQPVNHKLLNELHRRFAPSKPKRMHQRDRQAGGSGSYQGFPGPDVVISESHELELDEVFGTSKMSRQFSRSMSNLSRQLDVPTPTSLNQHPFFVPEEVSPSMSAAPVSGPPPYSEALLLPGQGREGTLVPPGQGEQGGDVTPRTRMDQVLRHDLQEVYAKLQGQHLATIL
jgi:hypothetical protein